MSFFQNFPTAIFSLNRNEQRIITDIFRRVVFTTPDNTAVILPYVVLDGETPELVSFKLYGTPLYHWVLLIINEIVDVRTEWPLEDAFITPLVYDKYDFSVFVANPEEYVLGDLVTSSDGGSFTVTEIADTYIGLRSTVGKTFLTIQSILTNVTQEFTGTIISVIDPEEATHHYEDPTTGYQVDFDPSNPLIEAVSNLDYELRENDAKRTIRVVDPRQIATISTSILKAYSTV
jgi:hypothetical protein